MSNLSNSVLVVITRLSGLVLNKLGISVSLMSLLLGADLPSDDSDSDFVEESVSESGGESPLSSKRSPRNSKNANVTSAIREAKIERIFSEMKSESVEASRPAESFVNGGEFWDLINKPCEAPPKDTSLSHVMYQIGQLSNTVPEQTSDFSRYKQRSSSSNLPSVSSLLASVDNQFIEITEEAKFAGKTVMLTRKVLATSSDAKRWLKKQESKPTKQETAAPLDSYLDSFVNAKRARTVNSMEKSAGDWSQFKDERNLQESLELERRKGFLDRQAFLSKVDATETEKAREAKRSRLLD